MNQQFLIALQDLTEVLRLHSQKALNYFLKIHLPCFLKITFRREDLIQLSI